MAKKYLQLGNILKRLLFDKDMKAVDLAREVNLPPPTIHQLKKLKLRLNSMRDELFNDNEPKDIEKLTLNIFSLTWSIVQFCLLVSGGLGLLETSSIQRLYREIIIWIIPRINPNFINNWTSKYIK